MKSFFLISNMYPTKDSPGYGSFVENISKALKNYGFIMKQSALIKGRSSGKLNKVYKYLNFYAQIVLRYFRKYDFIYIHFPNQAVPILYPLLKLKKRKLVVNLHGEDLMYNQSGYGAKLGKMMEDMCRKYADAIVVPSSYFKEIVVQRGIIDEKKVIVSPSGGINPSYFYPAEKDKALNHKLNIGYVGRLEPDKGILEYLDVCKKLKETNCDFEGIIIGYGTCSQLVNQFLIDNNLKNNVTHINGLPQSELGDYYRNMDFLIFSSSRASESLGLTGIEAMACGTPVIGSNIGGIATYVIPGYNGWLTPLKDTTSIISCLRQYLNMSEASKKIMRKNCILTGKQFYNVEVAKNLANHFVLIT